MFRKVTVRGAGAGASIARGYYTAAALRTWSVSKTDDGQWHLTATTDHVDLFQLRQKGLLFTAPRIGGFWCFPILPNTIQVQAPHIRASLGPPEH